MIEFGIEKITEIVDGNGSTKSETINYRGGKVNKSIKSYQIRVKVFNVKDEMTEFIKFSDEIRLKRSAGVLSYIQSEPTTKPYFVVEFPENDVDGSYFIIKNWSERL